MTTPSSLHVLVVDDEAYVRDHLETLLQERDEVDEVESASHGREAVEHISSADPDLIFLDVRMPKMSGLELVEEVGPDEMPATIFVTAYDQYAIQAFDLAAVDYLLKPFDEERFAKAFTRALQVIKIERVGSLTSHFEDLLAVSGHASGVFRADGASNGEMPTDDDSSSEASHVERLTIEQRNQIHVVPVEEIRYIAAEDMYVRVYTEDGDYLLRERLYEMEDRLAPSDFARIHRSTIVRLDCIERLVQRPGGDYLVQLDDAKTLPVSRSREEELLDRLEMGASS